MNSIAIMNFAPAALEKSAAAAYLAMGETTFEKLVREKSLPQPRQISDRRVAWLRTELDLWLISRPESKLLPPDNTGVPKPRAARKDRLNPSQDLPSAQPAL